jgi:hypothetical protein
MKSDLERNSLVVVQSLKALLFFIESYRKVSVKAVMCVA